MSFGDYYINMGPAKANEQSVEMTGKNGRKSIKVKVWLIIFKCLNFENRFMRFTIMV